MGAMGRQQLVSSGRYGRYSYEQQQQGGSSSPCVSFALVLRAGHWRPVGQQQEQWSLGADRGWNLSSDMRYPTRVGIFAHYTQTRGANSRFQQRRAADGANSNSIILVCLTQQYDL